MRELKFRAWVDTYSNWHMTNELVVGADGVFFHKGLSGITQKGWKLMQYTGLKDKNGKEIYEGDIVKNTWLNQILEVYWQEAEEKVTDSLPWMKEKPGFNFRPVGSEFLKIFTTKDLEVIGNIYEHKHLLGVSE